MSRKFRIWPFAAGLLAAGLAFGGPNIPLGVAWPEADYNPKAADGDVILPMPCAGAMALRKVYTPYERPLDDYAVSVGGTDDAHAYAENVRPAYISGSFAEGERERFYLIGKYEVSRLQYAAAEERCSEPTPEQRLPQTGVSWFDAVGFADRYSRWLRQHAAAQLPHEGEELGFVRLPTEVEWEFAARGGTLVSAADFRERVFPTPEGTVRYVWFAGTQSANGKAQFIGLLKPNPLGLHDILGNVDEMVLEPFRLNRLNRLHGQAGGFVVRGGNYFTSEQDVRSAYRREVPYYKGARPWRSKKTGFRIVVAAPVITSRGELQSIRDAWSDLGSAPPAAAASVPAADKPLQDSVEKVGELAADAVDPGLKARLAALQRELKGTQLRLRTSIQERADQHRLAARASLRLGGFLCQKLFHDGRALDGLAQLITDREAAFGRDDLRLQRYKQQRDEDNASLADNLQYYAETVLSSAEIYDGEVLADQLTVLRTQLERKGLQKLTRFAAMHYRHVMGYQTDSRVTRFTWLKDCQSVNTLPDSERRVL